MTARKVLQDEYPGVWYWEDSRWTGPLGEAIEAEPTAAAEQRLRAVEGALRGLVEAVVAMKQAIPLQSLGVEWREFLNKTGEVNLRLDLSEDLLALLSKEPE